MTIKHMTVMAVAALAFAGTAWADGPKDDPAVRQQMELRKAWQPGFEQGYSRANAQRDAQQLQMRQKMMKERQAKAAKFRGERKGPGFEGQGPKPPCAEGQGPKGPRADRGDRPRKPEMKDGDRPRKPGMKDGDRPRGPRGPRGEGRRGRKGQRPDRD